MIWFGKQENKNNATNNKLILSVKVIITHFFYQKTHGPERACVSCKSVCALLSLSAGAFVSYKSACVLLECVHILATEFHGVFFCKSVCASLPLIAKERVSCKSRWVSLHLIAIVFYVQESVFHARVLHPLVLSSIWFSYLLLLSISIAIATPSLPPSLASVNVLQTSALPLYFHESYQVLLAAPMWWTYC